MQICYVAGHSGGHIIPCITQIQNVLRDNPDVKILFFSTNADLDKKILSFSISNFSKNLPITNLPKSKLLIPQFVLKLIMASIKTAFYLIKNRPRKIISMGGLVSIPVCIIAKLFFIPIEIYELNVEPGKTIKLLSKLTNNINICFEATQKYFPKKNCNLIKYPIRFNEDIKKMTQQEALEKIKLRNDLKTILVLGGSQGSLFLNDLIKNFVVQNQNLSIQVIHQTGKNEKFDWQKFYCQHSIPAITFDYYHEMELYYLACDLVICRSGAGTLAEVIFFEKKCITIPLETEYTKHQSLNALELEKLYSEKIKVIMQNKINNMDIKQLI